MSKLLFRDTFATAITGAVKDRAGFAAGGGVHVNSLIFAGALAQLATPATDSAAGVGFVTIPGPVFSINGTTIVQEIEFTARMTSTIAGLPYVAFFVNQPGIKGIVLMMHVPGAYRVGILGGGFLPVATQSDTLATAGINGGFRGGNLFTWPVRLKVRCTLDTSTGIARIETWETSDDYGTIKVGDKTATFTGNFLATGPVGIGIYHGTTASSAAGAYFTDIEVRDPQLPTVPDRLALSALDTSPYIRQYTTIPPMIVQAVDAGGDVAVDEVTSDVVTVSVVEANHSIRGTLTRPIVNGSTTWDDLQVGGTPGNITLRFTRPGHLPLDVVKTLQRELHQAVTVQGVENGQLVPPPPVVWSSSNTAVATVDSSGDIVPVGAGTATITVAGGGVNKTITVDVGTNLRRQQ